MPGDYSSGGGALVAAAQWLEGTLLGPIATLIAVIAVGWVGILMLAGRIDLRRGASVIIGCFLVFGAPSISNGISNLVRGQIQAPIAIPPETLPTPRPAPTPVAVPYDPYAGASLPQ